VSTDDKSKTLPNSPMCMTKENAERFLLTLEDGREILSVLEVEANILERQKLIHGYHCTAGIVFEFPKGLLAFITSCRAFSNVCGPYITPRLERMFKHSEKEWGINK